MTVAIAVHVVFFWVLGLTMTAKTVDNIDQTKIEQVKENPNVEEEIK